MKKNSAVYIEYADIQYKLLLNEEKRRYYISNDFEGADVYIPDADFAAFVIEVRGENTREIYIASPDSEICLKVNVPQLLSKAVVTLYELYDDYYEIYIETTNILNFGAGFGNHIVMHYCDRPLAFNLLHNKEQWMLRLQDADNRVYINGILATRLQNIHEGDVITYRSYTFIFKSISLLLYHEFALEVDDVIHSTQGELRNQGYPYYKRSPRIFYEEPEEKISIPAPSQKVEGDKHGLLKTILPNIIMIGTTIGTGMLMGRGVMVLVMGVSSMVTLSTTVAKYFSDKKKEKEKEEERIHYYGRSLDQVRKRIRAQLFEQRTALELSLPSIAEEEKTIDTMDMKLWEKNPEHQDFLKVRVGTGTKSLSFPIEYQAKDSEQNEKDELHTAAKQLSNKYTSIHDVPISLDLSAGITGIVGEPNHVMKHAMAILFHTCVSHSYKDLQIIAIYPEHAKDLLWLKWMPHTWIGERQFKAMIKDSRTRDNILGSIYQVIKTRMNDKKESSQKQVVPSPRMLFVIADLALIFDHSIMEFLNQDLSDAGVYAIYLGDRIESLPEATANILLVDEMESGVMIKQNGVDGRQIYQPDFMDPVKLSELARKLAPIQQISNVTNTIPNSVTLFELYKIEEPKQYEILQRWDENKPYKTLAVPLGLRGTDDIVMLNLHEKAHGPHGLVAGTTGSGKSETIQSYIISLAINFHPYDVAFLLIDYKGGGMADLFKDLPHLLGTITNLDGAQTMRALVAIKSENLRRQAVFLKHGVNHVDQYQKLYNEGIVTEPMPHLFIISDEFAELKSEKPEFIKELVSTARIGRSLGVHLVLATQKPDGVVDEQISSNSKFRICLKVQNQSDSQSMIKTPDAAYITQAGRGYLMVGNNEIYELFQSAWSGAKYVKEKQEEINVDDNIYLFNDLGQTQLLTQDFSQNVKTQEKQSEVVTQLDATVAHISKTFDQLKLVKVPSPWLPPLAEKIYLSDLRDHASDTPNWNETTKELVCLLGRVDQPQKQAQSNLEINFTKSGHVAVFASATMGKSTFLRTAAIDLAMNYSPQEVNLYIFDFGSNSLLPLKDLPQTSDVMTIDSMDKIVKFERIITEQMKERKQKLGKAGVSSIDLYRKVTKEIIPDIVLFIDNFDIVKEQFESLEKVLTDVSRDGMSCGIYMILSASRSNMLKMNLQANIKNQMALYLIDKTEVYNIVGRTELQQEELPGRGFAKMDMVYSFQTALPVQAVTEEEMVSKFKEQIQKIQMAWKGEKVKPIPMLPERLSFEDFLTYPSVSASKMPCIPFGLDNERVEAAVFNFAMVNHLLLLGLPVSGKTNALKVIAEMLLKMYVNEKIYMFDDVMMKLNTYKKRENIQYVSMDDKAAFHLGMNELIEISKERKQAYINYIRAEGEATPGEFYGQFESVYVLVANAKWFVANAENQAAYGNLLMDVRQMGIHFIFCENATELKEYDALTKAVKAIEEGLLFINADKQQIWNLPYAAAKDKPLQKGEAYYIKGSTYARIKIPLL